MFARKALPTWRKPAAMRERLNALCCKPEQSKRRQEARVREKPGARREWRKPNLVYAAKSTQTKMWCRVREKSSARMQTETRNRVCNV